MHSAWS